MLRRYRFELILILLIICALVASRFFSLLNLLLPQVVAETVVKRLT
ncbi:Uncharacterised protein [Klebsiella michiganensis]|uniref:Uncharacterized protein n=1 Tax=Klebsiella michiganensis TaxID=1134687 RepID=A0A7H4PM50_9ENTR|nr:Uncharacterised protein [Klebsiella michiganensis]